MNLPDPRLLGITDRRQADRPLTELAEAIFAGGCRWLSLREKDLTADARRSLAVDLLPIARSHGAQLSVHDDLDLARELGALHLPSQGDLSLARDYLGPSGLVGISCHNRDEALAAWQGGADYITLSPIFESASKPDYGPALGLEGLVAIASEVDLPVLALAGVTADNAARCLAAGAAGVAVMGEVMGADDAEVTVRSLVESLG